MIGVDYDLFWSLNPESLAPFIKAFKMKIDYDNRMVWQTGAYIKMAISSSFNKNVKYPKEPPTVEKREVTQEEIMARFMNHVEMINSRFKGG